MSLLLVYHSSIFLDEKETLKYFSYFNGEVKDVCMFSFDIMLSPL